MLGRHIIKDKVDTPCPALVHYTVLQLVIDLVDLSNDHFVGPPVYHEAHARVGSNGNVDAMKFRDSIAKKMNKEQLEKANEMARRCVDFDYKDCDAKAKSWWKKLMD